MTYGKISLVKRQIMCSSLDYVGFAEEPQLCTKLCASTLHNRIIPPSLLTGLQYTDKIQQTDKNKLPAPNMHM